MAFLSKYTSYPVTSFTQRAPCLVIAMYSHSSPLKQKSMIECKTNINLSCGILVYRVEKSKVLTDFANPLLLIFVIASVTSLLFWIT